MKSGSRKSTWIFAILGIFPVVWFALLTAPYLSGGLMGIVEGLPEAMDHPFSMELCKDSAKTVLLFLLAYGLGIGIYLSTRRKRMDWGSGSICPPGESTAEEKNMVPPCGETSGRSTGNTVKRISWLIN